MEDCRRSGRKDSISPTEGLCDAAAVAAAAAAAAAGAALPASPFAAAGLLPFVGLARSAALAFPPVVAVNILHTLRFAGAENGEPPPLRPIALLAWLSGSVIGYLTSHDYFTVMGIASMDSIVVTAVVWLAGMALTRRSPVVA